MRSAQYAKEAVVDDKLAQSPRNRLPQLRTSSPAEALGRSHLRILAAAVAFLCVWLVVNRWLCLRPVRDSGDPATVLLQVYNAEHFHELLGNYSRWNFHHPGPAFMYIFALGDGVFRHLLHVAPAPWNSAALTLLVLYTCCLFATIFLFQQQSRSLWFLPLAVGASLWFIYVVNRTFPGSASGSIWMPYIILYSFLLFVAACASLAIGNGKHLPLAVLCGALLIHGHVAQCLFVGALLLSALLFWLVPSIRQNGVASTIKTCRTPLLISLGIALLFAFPILLEAALHHPSNLHKLNSYLREHRGPQNNWLTCVKYVCSFIAFIPDPEIVLLNPAAHLISRAAARQYVLAYWGMFAALLAAAIATRAIKRAKISPFLRYVSFELFFIVILCVFWARKIAGGLVAFNAHFFFATFLLASFVLIAFLVDAWLPARPNRWSLIVSCLLPLLMLVAPAQFQALQSAADQSIEPAVQAIVNNIPDDGKRIFLVWPDYHDFGFATGVASWLTYRQRTFCVANDRTFLFTHLEECRDLAGVEELEIARPPFRCEAPCRVLFQNNEIVATLSLWTPHRLPFQLQTDGGDMLPTDFNGVEGVHGPMWSTRHSAVHFLLSDQWNPTPTVRVIVKGVVRADDPVVISLNGHPLGTIEQAGLVSAEFKAPEPLFRAGAGNELSFTVDRAGPAGQDHRTLGFQLWDVQFLPQ